MVIDPITAIAQFGEMAINKIWPNPADAAKEHRKLAEIKQRGDVAELEAHVKLLQGQMEINKEEAKHKSLFVAGWRPAVGWVCGLSLLYVSFLEPIMRFVALMVGYTGEFPVINTFLTLQILGGMLGLSVSRSYDKRQKTQTDSLG